MEEYKSLKDISWQVPEPEYRQDKALSYSILSKYEREGFNNLEHLFDKVESPSLLFGSAVDTLITGSEEEFNEKFMVAELSTSLSDALVVIVKRIFERLGKQYQALKDIPAKEMLEAIENISWNNHWLPATRAKKIVEECSGYYSLLYLAGDRTIISTEFYRDVLNTRDKLLSSASTKFYFEPNKLFDNDIERFYQLKFKATLDGVDYRCMPDELIVVHSKKLVVPVDLKTSYKPEWDFYKSFIEWNYHIQARLYWRIIRANMDKDPYFKDYELADYKFIVANKHTLTPLVWDFRSTQAVGDIVLGKNNNIVFRDPCTIGKELSHYLTDNPTVPDDIDIVKPNNIEHWINKL